MVKIGDIKMYNLEELHQATGIAITTFRRWIKEGRLPAKKVARKWLVSEETIRQLFGKEK